MSSNLINKTPPKKSIFNYTSLLCFIAGGIAPLGFAPFHTPGVAVLSISLFWFLITTNKEINAAFFGFVYGLGYYGIGVSWVYVSIHNYGHLNFLISGLATLLFISYLALFFSVLAYITNKIEPKLHPFLACLFFSSIWCLIEFIRATFMGGFPWLLMGYSQMDSPLKYLLPIIGVYGVSFLTCLAATFIVNTIKSYGINRFIWLILFLSIFLCPLLIKEIKWTKSSDKPITVATIQANLSMRDKWDENIYWQLMDHYKKQTDDLIPNKQVIVLPESAIPVPQSYVVEYLEEINKHALQENSSVILGIPEKKINNNYQNSLIALGDAGGEYRKIHLVPFGEYIPKLFTKLINFLEVPISNMEPGTRHQSLVHVHNTPIATLICYELAYPYLLRDQLPLAEWVVSISDDGWFGHSLAAYQQLQMAQILSILSGRYQVVANNDGLSSIINTSGTIQKSLPAFKEGILTGEIYTTTGSTPWARTGDYPILITAMLIIVISFIVLFINRDNK